MSGRKTKDKIGATRSKLALVAVLSVVLVAVLVGQPPDDPPVAKATARRTPTKPKKLTENNSNKQAEAKQSAAIARPWPKLTTEEVLQHDPFVIPVWAAAPEKEIATPTGNTFTLAGGERLEQLQEQGASVVVITGQDRIATIGDQQIRVGDSIEGYSVIDITTQGIVLASPKSR